MDRFDGSRAVSKAESAVFFFGMISILAAVPCIFIGIADDEMLFVVGVACLAVAITCFINHAILKGFRQLVKAGEVYMEEVNKKNLADMDEKKKESDDKIDYLCQD